MSNYLFVSHYHSTNVQNKRMYYSNQAADCKFAPRNLNEPLALSFGEAIEPALQQQCVQLTYMFFALIADYNLTRQMYQIKYDHVRINCHFWNV